MAKHIRDDYLRNRPAFVGEWQEKAAHAWEERQTQFLLQELDLLGWKGQMLGEARKRYGRPRLTLELFNDTFTGFPVLLGADHLPGIQLYNHPQAILPALFKNFAKAPFLVAFARWLDEPGRDDSIESRKGSGLVFPRKGIVRGLIVHTVSTLSGRQGTVMTWAGDEHWPTLHLEPFAQFIAAVVASGWRPTGS